jgi:hypothetical protein
LDKPTRTRRQYTKRQKATAVVAAELVGQSAAAEQAGVPLSTLHQWMMLPAYAELRNKTRADMADEMRVIAHLALRRIAQRIDDFEPRDLSILLGIAIDKSQLLSGQATERTEHLDITDGMDDHEKATLRDILDEAIRSKEAADAG